jgi:hypothetical protein
VPMISVNGADGVFAGREGHRSVCTSIDTGPLG